MASVRLMRWSNKTTAHLRPLRRLFMTNGQAELAASGSIGTDVCNKPSSMFEPHLQKGLDLYKSNPLPGDFCQNIQQMTRQALHNVPVDKESPFCMCDFGCSAGTSFMPLAYDIIQTIREKYGSSIPIQVFFEDQAFNDFSSLFLYTHGMLPGPKSLLLDFSNVYTFASGTNFYEQCFPSDTLNLAYMSLATNWLSERPCAVSNGLYISQSDKKPERDLFRSQAATDLTTLLLRRAKELKKGGILMISELCTDNSGYYADKDFGGKPGFYDIMYRIMLGMAEEGLIDHDEVLHTSTTIYYRSEEEMLEPFKDNSQVRSAGLQLVKMEKVTTECPPQMQWQTSTTKGGAEAVSIYARSLAENYRSWCNHVFMNGLSEKRKRQEKEAIVDEMFQRYENKICEDPTVQAPLFFPHFDLEIVKTS